MAKLDVQYVLDTPRSSRNGGSVVISGSGGSGGGGSVDFSLYLKRDGTVPMTGDLDMGGFSVSNVSLLDGVDLPAHVSNINAHHSKVHVLANQTDLGDDHTIVGSIGQVLRVYASNKARFEVLNHTDLANVLPDQHHSRQHDVASASDHTASGTSMFDVFGIPGSPNIVGWLTPSASPTSAALLRSDNSGGLTLRELRIGSATTLFSGGDVGSGPDIQFYGSGLLAAQNNLFINADSSASGNGVIIFSKGTNTSSATEMARFSSAGNFGIGMTPGAAYRLDVTGDARISSSVLSSIFTATTKITTPIIESASGSVTVNPANNILIVNTRLRTENIDTAAAKSLTIEPAVSILLNPGDNRVVVQDGKAVRTDVFVSGFAGSGFHLDQGILRSGKTTLEIDDLTVRGRMSVYELLIRQIRATNGSLFVSSTARAKRVSTVSGGYRIITTTLEEEGAITDTTEHAHGFLPNDIIRAQRSRWDGTQFLGIYQCDLRVTAVDSLTNFRAVLVSGDVPTPGMEFVRLGNTTDTTRQGTIYLTSDDTASPYIDIVNGVASHANWNSTGFVKVRLGLLTGITSTANEYGMIAGNGIFSPTNPAAKYIRASNEGVFLYGAGLKMYRSGQQTVDIANDGTMWLGPSSSNKIFEFDGNILNLRGALLIGPQIPNTGFTTDAILYCAYDGTWDSGNDAGNATGHLGQQETFSNTTQYPQFRKGKFGKAIESVEAQTSTTINLVVNSSLEDGTVGGNPTNFGSSVGQFASYISGAVDNVNSSVTISEDMSFDGKRSYKIVRKTASPTSTNYGIQYRYNVVSGQTYSIQVKVFVASVTNPLNSTNVFLYIQDNVTSDTASYSNGTTEDWVTLKIKATATASGVSRIFIFTDNCEDAVVYVDAIQITNTAYHLPYYLPKKISETPTYETSRAIIYTRYLNQNLNFRNLTISTWFFMEDLASVVGRTLRICEILINTNNRVNITIDTSDKVTVFYVENGVVASLANNSQPSLTANTWHHVAVTFANGVFSMYVNGVLWATNNYTSPISGNCEVRVGAYISGQPLNGWIDDFAIIPRGLSADEISQIFGSVAPLRVLSSAFELQLMKIGATGLKNIIYGNASGIFASIVSATTTTPSFALFNDDVSSWGGFASLKAGDVIIGDSAGQYLKFKREDGTMILKGQLIITGASGYGQISDRPTNLSAINSSEGSKLSGIQAGATVGADWSTNLGSIPPRFGDSPSSTGLYLTATHLGYWQSGSPGSWKMWMSNTGNFYFGGSTGARIQWNGSVLAGYNSGNILQWSADSTDGLLKAGGGNVWLSENGLFVKTAVSIDPTEIQYSKNRINFVSHLSDNNIAYIGAGATTGLETFGIFTNTPNNSLLAIRSYTSDASKTSTIKLRAFRFNTNAFAEISMSLTAFSISSPSVVRFLVGDVTNPTAWQGIEVSTLSVFSTSTFYSNMSITGELGVSGNISGSNLFINGSIVSASAVGFTTSGGAASIPVYAKQYMASSDFSHSIRIPTNGIYSLGGVSIGRTTTPDINYILDVLGNTRLTGTLAVTGAVSVASLSSSGVISGASLSSSSGNIFTSNGFTAPKLASTPTLTDGVCMIYFKETGGVTRIVFAYREGATTYYYYNRLEDMSGGWIHSTTAP